MPTAISQQEQEFRIIGSRVYATLKPLSHLEANSLLRAHLDTFISGAFYLFGITRELDLQRLKNADDDFSASPVHTQRVAQDQECEDGYRHVGRPSRQDREQRSRQRIRGCQNDQE